MVSKTVSMALLLLVAACGGAASDVGAGATPADEHPAPFVAVDIDYAEAPDEVAAGEVTVELVNEGSVQHNVVIEELDDTLVVEAPGGATETGTVTLPAGTYTYYCSVPGHRAAGMEGMLEAVD